uniref:Uncharacterized protein n=1 Tax=Candidatus Kentrum sp. LFY TaxID=2126342 RepID=A0A450WUT2_9GAMM|nr:MAG: hypothetical protein BECKLFY1418C_GA0070996_107818 [Candidatus Kentron sp. LFY]
MMRQDGKTTTTPGDRQASGKDARLHTWCDGMKCCPYRLCNPLYFLLRFRFSFPGFLVPMDDGDCSAGYPMG